MLQNDSTITNLLQNLKVIQTTLNESPQGVKIFLQNYVKLVKNLHLTPNRLMKNDTFLDLYFTTHI